MSKSIYDFKKGDEVVRTQASKPVGYTVMNPEGHRDRSYIGNKMIFVGIANGCIYLQRTGIEAKMFPDKLVDLPLDLFDEGWDLYIDPEKLLEEVDSIIPMEALQRALHLALQKEDYEAAENLKKRIEIKNKG
jgi:hypothetical protein